MAIKLNSTPNIAPGFVMLSPFEFKPDSITITGPESHINDIDFISPVLKEDVLFKSNEVLTSELYNPYPEFVLLSKSSVDMSIYVEQLIEKSLYLPIQLLGVTDSIQIFPTIIKSTFNLPLKYFNEVDAFDFNIHADFGNRTTTKLPLTLLRKPAYINKVTFDVDSIEYLLVKPVE